MAFLQSLETQPLISIIMPAYNHGRFLIDALTSIREQTYAHWELIIVDDGSIDDTHSICQSYATLDPRIDYQKLPHQGPSAARNHGIALSHGEYICFLDADDRMDPRKLELQLAHFKAHPEADIVYTALYLMDIKGEALGEVRAQAYSPENFLVHMFFRNMIPGPSTIMAKRACLLQHPYHAEFRHAEDYELMMRLAHCYHFQYLDIPLMHYRRHTTGLSNNLIAHGMAELKVLRTYSQSHIDEVINRSSLSQEEKVLMKGKILFKREDYQEALVIFEQQATALAYFYAGNCWVMLENLEKALVYYEQSLTLDSNNPACYNNQGVLLKQRGDLEQARLCFEKALQLKSDYLDARLNLAGFYEPACSKLTLRELRMFLIPY